MILNTAKHGNMLNDCGPSLEIIFYYVTIITNFKEGIIMIRKATVKIEVKKGDHTYEFIMPVGSPFGEAYDSAFEILQEISTMAKDAVSKVKREEVKIKTDADKKEEKE